MPSLSPFSTVAFDDENGIKHWLFAHSSRHKVYNQALTRAGTAIGISNLETAPDAEWFSRHMLAHKAISQTLRLGDGQQLQALYGDNWQDESSFNDWHGYHTAIHATIDRALGIGSQL